MRATKGCQGKAYERSRALAEKPSQWSGAIETRSRIAAAKACGWSARRNPVTPSITISRGPPRSVATTGFPHAIDSRGTSPQSSFAAAQTVGVAAQQQGRRAEALY